MTKLHQELKDIATEIEQTYYTGEFGVNSDWSKFFKGTKYENMYMDMAVHFRETIGLMVDLYIAMKKDDV